MPDALLMNVDQDTVSDMSEDPPPEDDDHATRLLEVVLDEESIRPDGPEVQAFRENAIYNLLQKNMMSLPGRAAGPYTLLIVREQVTAQERLVLHVGDRDKKPLHSVFLSMTMTDLRRIVKEYINLCDRYQNAARSSDICIEAVDMGRRASHNEGATLLRERLEGKIDLDHETARRLFALISAIYRKGRC